MTDYDRGPPIPPSRLREVLPIRPSAQEAAAVSAEEATVATEEEIERAAQQAHEEALERRSQARLDALTVVSKAIRRRGDEDWSLTDADTVHAITELLLKVQSLPMQG
jgi:hypothetical protein